ncbi:MFS transporter [Phenylobacterium sp.]|uniref:MFS transporter n=1 Tax=Phenylobacterium sp. TaxID=1871053 RepID=UPI0025F89236|nr:MFS transporter [Phenylobacterium sp.]
MAFVKTAGSFYLVRFLLGVAEAGFFPGVIYYLTQWVPAARRAQLIGLFMTAIPISTALGGPISSAILRLDGVFGLAGWQWLFLTETAPSFCLGVATLIYLPDRPADAKWLSAPEKAWLTQTLEAEQAYRHGRYGSGLAQLATDPRVWLLCLAYFGVEIGLYGVIFWLPQILRTAGVADGLVGYLVAVPYGVAALAMVWWCRRSDRAKERVWHIAAASLVGALGLAGSAFLAPSPALAIVAITLGAVGTLAILPVFWTLPASTLNGAAAAAGIAAINAVGNIGGFVGPFAIGWIKDATGDFTYGLLALAGGVLLTGVVTLAIGCDSAAEQAGAGAAPVATSP